jgi:hypothetical protein
LEFFDLLGLELLEVVEESKVKGKINGALNATFVDLIPKSDKPESFDGFRPISLCNLMYKVISKIIAFRIKSFLSKGISKEQFGFLENRQITDEIGVAQETLHSIKIKKSKALVLKLDMMKAYDRVDWSFLRLVLLQIGLSLEATDWIMGCVRSANFSVLINGSPSRFFRISRGLRQGCPLSPLLFLIIVEGLSRILLKLVEEGKIEGVSVANGVRITHLLFVDDIILFGKGSLTKWETLKDVLICFAMLLE